MTTKTNNVETIRIGARIKDRRESLGMNQTQLAKKSEVSRSRINELEHDDLKTREMKTETLKALAIALETSTDYLLGITELDENDINSKESKTVQLVCKYTGLSPNAIKNLHSLKWRTVGDDSLGSVEDKPLLIGINEMLDDKQRAWDYLYSIGQYVQYNYHDDFTRYGDTKKDYERAIVIYGYTDDETETDHEYLVPLDIMENHYLEIIKKIVKKNHHDYQKSTGVLDEEKKEYDEEREKALKEGEEQLEIAHNIADKIEIEYQVSNMNAEERKQLLQQLQKESWWNECGGFVRLILNLDNLNLDNENE